MPVNAIPKPSQLSPIQVSAFKIGQPVPWDIYDAKGSLLLRKGFTIADARQLDVFAGRDLFIEKADKAQGLRLAMANASVVSILGEAASALRSLHQNIIRGLKSDQTQDKTFEIANTLAMAISVNTDICLANIFYNKFGHDDYPLHHSLDTAILSILMAQAMEKPEEEIELIAASALTMNVGMLTLQEQLLKRSDKLTATEKTKIHQHPEGSVDLLRKAGISDENWLNCVRDHHEKIDGSGYPSGLTGADIPECAQIVSLADRYSACLSPRRYRPGMLATEVMRGLFIEQASTIDVMLAGQLVKVLGVYPPGSFVRLQNGEIAVVVRRGKMGTTPLVISFIAPRGGPMAHLVKRDTREKTFAVRGGVRLEQKDVPHTMAELWGKQAEAE
ncbi:MAG: HD-GYP domain-containing protein [Methylococcaceae bacterium]